MAKEFDAYLRSRLMECKIVVSSIPYRNTSSMTDALRLETIIEDLALQKFIAVETESELTAEIDGLLTLCYERLNNAATFGCDAQITSEAIAGMERSGFVLGQAVTGSLLDSIAHGESDMAMTTVVTWYEYARTSGRIGSGVTLSQSLSGVYSEKTAAINAASELLAEVSFSVQKFLPGPVTSEAVLHAVCYLSAGHYRTLEEVDDNTLAELDGDKLGDIDFESQD